MDNWLNWLYFIAAEFEFMHPETMCTALLPEKD